jgi:hypothetical protein
MESVPPGLKPLVDELREQAGAALDGLVGRLLNARSGVEFYDVERAVHQALRGLGDALVGGVLRFLAADPRLVEPCRAYWTELAARQGERLQSNGYKETAVRLLGGGVVSVKTLRLARVRPTGPGRKPGRGKRGKAGTGLYPALAQLGIVGKATPALMAEVAREVAESQSVAVARESLSERGLGLHHSVALRLAYTMAERALEARRRRFEGRDGMLPVREDGQLFAGRRLLVSVDGGRLKIRENPVGGRRREATGHRRYDGVWREPKVLTIVVLDERGRRDPKVPPLLDATMGDADAVVALVIGHLKAHGGAAAAEVTLVADGAEWIWNRAQWIREQVGIDAKRWHEVLDYYHVVEHLSEVTKLVKSWDAKQRSTWLKLQKGRLLQGRLHLVLEDVQALRIGRRSKGIRAQLNYLRTHKNRLDYKACKEHRRPMGSGAVESGVRRVVNLRMKGNSIFWLEEHAEGLLHLRSILKSGRWTTAMHDAISTPAWALAA